jgi:hypothetical protein
VDDITTEVATNDEQEAVALLQDFVQFARKFAEDFVWRAKRRKSRRFSILLCARAALRELL